MCSQNSPSCVIISAPVSPRQAELFFRALELFFPAPFRALELFFPAPGMPLQLFFPAPGMPLQLFIKAASNAQHLLAKQLLLKLRK